MTRKAISKLPEKCRRNLETKANIMLDYRQKGNKELLTETRKKMRGYLECLVDTGILEEIELRALYLYYNDIQKKF